MNGRQAETVEKLFTAASELLREVGHEQMTIRTVAQRAGVSPATAYTYFASKDHLFGELFARLFVDPDELPLTESSPHARTREVMSYLASVIAGFPELAAAVNKGLLASEPEVERLRLEIGGRWVGYLRNALGADVEEGVIETLTYAFTGALLQSGIGLTSYADLDAVLGQVADVVVGQGTGRGSVERVG